MELVQLKMHVTSKNSPLVLQRYISFLKCARIPFLWTGLNNKETETAFLLLLTNQLCYCFLFKKKAVEVT